MKKIIMIMTFAAMALAALAGETFSGSTWKGKANPATTVAVHSEPNPKDGRVYITPSNTDTNTSGLIIYSGRDRYITAANLTNHFTRVVQ